MRLDGLIDLYRSMKDQVIDRYRFEYRHGKALFDVFFLIDESPFILLFGAKGETFSFEMEVKAGFQINPTLDKETYKELCRVLGLEYDPDNPFSPKGFFEQFNNNIPKNASANSKAEPQDIAQYRNIAEEEDKKYFLGWRNSDIRAERVTETNLMKTKELLGQRAYARCASKNISSCWTDDPVKGAHSAIPG
ncbi:MAG: rloe protein [Planctomycetes bacterium]|nr:rloe protein [Planctomycetota bacterium]